MIKLYIENDAIIKIRDADKNTPLIHVAKNIYKKPDTVEICKILIKAGSDPFEKDEKYHNGLFHAVINNDNDLMRMFIKVPGFDINALDKIKRNVLIYAILHDNNDAAETLIASGIELKYTDKYGKMPRCYAIEKDNDYILELIEKN